jgi:UDP-N-acetylglucosamine--N-acetylmuramyl-(pentapeptide) pyrophosphoryl-undecaprenol N-acetylglucosamine transferase
MSKQKALHILFAGGGTGGHIAPLLAVMEQAQRLAKQEGITLRCSFVGMKDDLASPLIKESKLQFETYTIHSGKLHRYITKDQVRQLRNLIKGVREAKELLKKLQPDVVLAKGGYSTVPVAWAAARMGVPVYCHETDSAMGLANRLLARFVKGIFTGYPRDSYPAKLAKKVRYVGQPVRGAFYQSQLLPKKIGKQSLDPKRPVITVVGGSQGARRINRLISESWAELAAIAQVVHITGPAEHKEYEKRLKKMSPAVKAGVGVYPFLQEEIPALFQQSAVVVSRAGGSVAELAASRACVVVVPLSTAAQNHQWKNAQVLEKTDAALVIDERTTNPGELLATLRRILNSPQEQTALRASIGQFDRPKAAEEMARVLLGIETFH